ncbi:CRISPR-associated protein Cas1 [uncultured archaeon]|nr:CRISPR-associated protein Cas1 [uncultured archaeon]
MKRLLNTLFITTPDSYLTKQGENLLIKVKDEIKFRIPVHNLDSVICFGHMGASPSAMQLCAERGVGLSFLTPNGRFQARVTGRSSGNVLLRRKQFRWADSDDERLRLTKRFVTAKIHNSRRVIQRLVREHDSNTVDNGLPLAIGRLKEMISRIDNSDSVDSVRGIEGEAATLYFSNFDSMILNQKDQFNFQRRVRRPPTDPVNALLSFVYTLLAHDCSSALESVGLDSQVGFLHTDRPGRESLALDLMEELRPYVADRLVLTIINRKQVVGSGFIKRENGTVLMDDATRKEVIMAWQNRKREEIVHPFLNEKIPIGLIPYVQSMLLARNLRGDLSDYPPFLWK